VSRSRSCRSRSPWARIAAVCRRRFDERMKYRFTRSSWKSVDLHPTRLLQTRCEEIDLRGDASLIGDPHLADSCRENSLDGTRTRQRRQGPRAQRLRKSTALDRRPTCRRMRSAAISTLGTGLVRIPLRRLSQAPLSAGDHPLPHRKPNLDHCVTRQADRQVVRITEKSSSELLEPARLSVNRVGSKPSLSSVTTDLRQ
jgi:hypothetical protein